MLTCCFKAVRCHKMSHKVMWWWFRRNAQLNNIMGRSLFPTLWERQNTLKGAGLYWLITTLYTVTDNLFYIAENLCLWLWRWIFFWNKLMLIILFWFKYWFKLFLVWKCALFLIRFCVLVLELWVMAETGLYTLPFRSMGSVRFD